LLTVAVAGALGYLTARSRLEANRRRKLESLLRGERQKLTGILEKMEDGVVIIAPDYRIRFMNSAMTRLFGEGSSPYCYRTIRGRDTPCNSDCPLSGAAAGRVQRLRYVSGDGKTFDVVASPYPDTDGVVCQLATYRDASGLGTTVSKQTRSY
jgi:PAS domain-containing protein